MISIVGVATGFFVVGLLRVLLCFGLSLSLRLTLCETQRMNDHG